MMEIAIKCDFLQDLLNGLYAHENYQFNLKGVQVKNDRIELVKGKKPTDAAFRLANAFKAVFPHLSGQVIYMCLENPRQLAYADLLDKLASQYSFIQVQVAEFIVSAVVPDRDPSERVKDFIKAAIQHTDLFKAVLKSSQANNERLPAADLAELLKKFGPKPPGFWEEAVKENLRTCLRVLDDKLDSEEEMY